MSTFLLAACVSIGASDTKAGSAPWGSDGGDSAAAATTDSACGDTGFGTRAWVGERAEGPYAGPPVHINEAMAEEKGGAPVEGGDWIELYNPGTAPVDLDGSYLDEGALGSTAWPIPCGVTIAGGGYLLVGFRSFADVADVVADYRLNEEGDDVFLDWFNPDGTVGVASRVQWTEQLRAPNSLARIPDGSENWQVTASPTPGAANR